MPEEVPDVLDGNTPIEEVGRGRNPERMGREHVRESRALEPALHHEAAFRRQLFRNRFVANRSTVVPMSASAANWLESASNPAPFRNTARTIST